LIALIQARLNSKRFKKKALHLIKNKELILHVVEAVKKSKNISEIIITTSNLRSDDKLVYLLKKYKIKIYRGSLNNVALRMLKAAQKFKIRHFIRISGDSPLIDYKIIDYAIETFKNHKNSDLVTNIFPRKYPSGQSVEIIKTKTLEKNIKNFSLIEKEHVTKYFYSNYKKFKIANFKKNFNYYKNLPKLSIDYKSDLKKIMKYFKD
jgi:spore coat polysaccharide biosynthesis protein SpsF